MNHTQIIQIDVILSETPTQVTKSLGIYESDLSQRSANKKTNNTGSSSKLWKCERSVCIGSVYHSWIIICTYSLFNCGSICIYSKLSTSPKFSFTPFLWNQEQKNVNELDILIISPCNFFFLLFIMHQSIKMPGLIPWICSL